MVENNDNTRFHLLEVWENWLKQNHNGIHCCEEYSPNNVFHLKFMMSQLQYNSHFQFLVVQNKKLHSSAVSDYLKNDSQEIILMGFFEATMHG